VRDEIYCVVMLLGAVQSCCASDAPGGVVSSLAVVAAAVQQCVLARHVVQVPSTPLRGMLGMCQVYIGR
jgi:uncharacterized membrane protein